MYLALVFAFSSFFYFPLIRSVSIRNGRGLYVLSLMLGLMWSPALAGMLTLWLNGRSVAELGWRWGKTKYQVWSWFIPVLYASIAYAIVWIVGFGRFGNPEFYNALGEQMHLGGPLWVSVALGIALAGTLGMVGSVLKALGEEIGWRGFLVPELSKTSSYTVTCLVSGIIW